MALTRTARTIADDCEMPGEIAQVRERGHQQIVALARDDGADRENAHGPVARSLCRARLAARRAAPR